MGCNRNPDTDAVEALDAYNDPRERQNNIDPHQNVVQFSANFTDGRIKCRWTNYVSL